MWYRIAQARQTAVYSPGLKSGAKQWAYITWSDTQGLQFWTSSGQLVGSQQPGKNTFDTLRSMEPYRFPSDFSYNLLLDAYRQGKAAEQHIGLIQQQYHQNAQPQVIKQILSKYFANYRTKPQLNADGNMTNLPEYYPPVNAQTNAATQQSLEREWMAAPKQPGEQAFQATPAQSQETGQQRRVRYQEAYNKAYQEYEANGRKMPFQQWKAQFDKLFTEGRYGTPGQQVAPAMNQVTTPNQAEGTYKMQQDANGNVHILQADGRAYAYVPADQVQYQLQYIKRMTGQTPTTK